MTDFRDKLRAKFAPFDMGAGCLTSKEIADMCIEALASERATQEPAAPLAAAHYHIDEAWRLLNLMAERGDPMQIQRLRARLAP